MKLEPKIKSFNPLLPHETSIQYLGFNENDNSSNKKLNSFFDSNDKSLNKYEKEDSNNVGVFIRIRPFLNNELKLNIKNNDLIKIINNQIQIQHPEATSRKWLFHNVFNEECGQRTIFQKTCVPLLESTLQGYNTSMFVYGQTGTGKFYLLLNKLSF